MQWRRCTKLNRVGYHQSWLLSGDRQKFGCGSMHGRAATSHSQKPGIFVHFATLHGLRKAFRGPTGDPGGKSSPLGLGDTKNSVPQPVLGAVGGAQRTRRGGGPQLVLGQGLNCAPACICRGGPQVASGCGAANIATHFVLAHSGCATPFVPTCRWESGSHYLLFLEEDCGTMLESADACGVGFAAVSGDLVESTNYILKKGYNGHTSRGWGAGKSAVEREAMVFPQVWEWWFLTFDPPLLHYNTPLTAARTAPSLLSTTPQASSTQAPSATQLYYSSPIHGRRRAEEAVVGESQGDPHHGGMLSLCCCTRS